MSYINFLPKGLELSLKVQPAIGGALAGYALVKNNIITEEKWFAEPIKNKITRRGLHGFLKAGQCSSTSSSKTHSQNLWVGLPSSVLQYCAAGTDNTPTGFDDEALKGTGLGTGGAVVYSSTKYTITGTEYAGTKYSSGAQTVTLRITHRQAAAAQDTLVGEVGWFYNDIADNAANGWRMFSRVALPTPILVPVGYILQTTYDVTVNIPYYLETPIDLKITGWKDADGGNDCTGIARCVAELSGLSSVPTFGDGGGDLFSTISKTGESKHNNYNNFSTISMLDVSMQDSGGIYGKALGIYATRIDFPAIGAVIAKPTYGHNALTSRDTLRSSGDSAVFTRGFPDLALERSIYWRLGLHWPNNIEQINIGFLNINGLGVKLNKIGRKRWNEQLEIEYQISASAV